MLPSQKSGSGRNPEPLTSSVGLKEARLRHCQGAGAGGQGRGEGAMHPGTLSLPGGGVSCLWKSKHFPSVQANSICCGVILTLSHCPQRAALTCFLSVLVSRTRFNAHGYQNCLILTSNPDIYRFQVTHFCFWGRLRQPLMVGRTDVTVCRFGRDHFI